MTAGRPLAIAVLWLLALAGVADAAPRVLSLDQCADQFLLALSPRAAIVGLSPRALADDSFLRAKARGLPIVRADTEAILGAAPRVVVRYWGGTPGLIADLKRRGVTVVAIEDATDFTGVRANIRRVARALDAVGAGEALVSAMDAKLALAANAWGGKRAVYLTSGGATSGKGTLIDAMLGAAGLKNATQTVGYAELSIESLVARPPDAIVGGFFDRPTTARQPWGIGRHRVLRDLMRRKALVSLPGAVLGCPAWFAADGVAALAAAARALVKLIIGLALALLAVAAAAVALGETSLPTHSYLVAFDDPRSSPAEILWGIRAPRVAAAAMVGAALGLSGAVMQGLLRNPLADPGVLGVSAVSALGAAICIVLGLAVTPGLIEAAALAGAVLAGAVVVALAARLETPQTLILFGVALSAMGGAGTALVFNLSPSPIATADVLSWLMGSVANRDWDDAVGAAGPMLLGAALCLWSGRGLRMLTLGPEGAAMSGLPMSRLRAAAVAGAALLTGASVAMAGVIGFVGLAAPHLVRGLADDDPAALLAPSALTGAILLVLADLAARMIPTAEPMKLGVMTALVGAPLFALIVWRAARSWR